MALVKLKKMDSGIELPDAYHKITAISLELHHRQAYVTISIYKDKAARDQELAPIMDHVQSISAADFDSVFGLNKMDESGKNVINLSYEHIKQLPDFSGANDI